MEQNKEREAFIREINWSEWYDYNPDTGQIALKAEHRMRGPVKYFSGSQDEDGYMKVKARPLNKFASVHRIAMSVILGRPLLPSEYVDHINGVRNDNRADNLRLATSAENQWNLKWNKRNTSGYKGVSWVKKHSNWRAKITVNGRYVSLGSFNCKHEAAHAYNKAAIAYHGEFAILNPVGVE